MFTTLVIGASTNPNRYAYKAISNLRAQNFPVVAIGRQEGTVANVNIVTHRPEAISNLGIVTLYINPKAHEDYYDYIVQLKPKKVIFNPGTENAFFAQLLQKNNIQTENACTLVLLSLNAYNTN